MENRQGSWRGPGIEILSLFLFGLAVFSIVALATYWHQDPSLLSTGAGDIRNACGKVGAYLASALFQLFGLAAFLFPLSLGMSAYSVHQREGKTRILGLFAGMLVSVAALTVFLSINWKSWSFGGSVFLTGGALGAWAADALSRQFNSVGASIVALIVFAAALAASTPISIAKLGGRTLVFLSLLTFKTLRWALAAAALGLMRASVFLAKKCVDRAARALENGKTEKAKIVAPPSVTLGIPKVAPEPSIADAEVVPIGERDEIDLSRMRKDLEKQGPEILSSMGTVLEPPALEAEPEQEFPKKRVRAAPVRSGPWKLPPLEFLRKAPKVETTIDRERLLKNSEILVSKLADFGIEGEVTAVCPGPVVTLYEFKPGPGIKLSKIAALADDLSMALAGQSVRIVAPIPGKSAVGIELPSDQREKVFIREFIQHPDFRSTKYTIPVVMGKDIGGQAYLSDLARMPHLLCAGQTGSGKSVFMNSLICSLFYRFTPDELRMILVDPKFIEFRSYQDLPHLLLPVVDDPKQAAIALKWAVREMERRYRLLALMGARNLAGFNLKVEELGAEAAADVLLSEESEDGMSLAGGDWRECFERDENGEAKIGKLPTIVVIIDELADLMMIAKKDVEISIARIAQKARAAGIHLVIATQRPSTDVVTGLIKANLPSRVSFQLASFVDSKTIIDRSGAERLLGQGDMLFIPPGIAQAVRLHGAYVDDEEIGKITAFWRTQGRPAYRNEILVDEEEAESMENGATDEDALFDDAIDLVKRSGHASASFLQRHLKVGYNRAARMIETMEERGIVGPADGARPREVLIR